MDNNFAYEKLCKLKRILKVFLEYEEDIDYMVRALESKGIKITWAELCYLIEE